MGNLNLTDTDEAEVERAYRERSADDFLLFASGLVIPSASGPQLFELCMADFQREFFRAVAPSLHAVRDGKMPPCRRHWMERTKKASKDTDVAVCLLWLMAFSTRPLLVQVCASNNKQARIIEDRAVEIVHENPWLNDRVEILRSCIRSRESPREVRVQIEATGTPGAAQGPTPDLLVLNELVHVDRWPVMEAHMNNADGVPRGVAIISTNAGIKGSKAEGWRNRALANRDRWKVLIWHKRAPWLSVADVAEAKARDPVGSEFARLFCGKWISGLGDAVDEDSIEQCFRADGPLDGPEPGWQYVAGLDLGVSHDHAGVALLGANEGEQRIRVAWLRGWEPSVPNDRGTLEVDSAAVEESCLWLHKTFRMSWFGYDPAAGGSFMAQRLRRSGVPMREMTFSSPKNCTDMAVAFVQAVKDGKLECYEDEGGRLRRDFGKFSIVHKLPSGYKLEAVSDEHGHADVGTALVICLPRAVEMLGGGGGLLPEDVLASGDDSPLRQDEVDDMPLELRDIYDGYGEQAERHRGRKRDRDFGEDEW